MDKNLFHNLNGENICFKALDPKDAQVIHSYVSDEEVKRFIGWRLMRTLEETREFVEELIRREEAGTHLYASIVKKSSQTIIGTAMIFGFDKEANHAEIGYVLHKEHWSKGYGTEAVALISDFAFEILKLHKLHARVVSGNLGSARILEKNGFELEGRFRDYYFIEGNYYDGLFFGKFPSLIK
jgi:[ribosomal protein S5]-alanine N-acetyltransferase